uniref:IRF tryptophan pentad repeat domain-containing protein n=1 Tax=Macrostomum lignano TaxID=282301 RepID=A0A1I8GJX2_9PLAT
IYFQAPKAKHMLTTWLKTRLNEGRFQRLAWVDKSAGIFTMSWMHHNSSSWNPEEFEVFLDWERYSNRNKATGNAGNCSDWTACKARLRCAINKSPLIKVVDRKPRNGQRRFQLVNLTPSDEEYSKLQRDKLLQRQERQRQVELHRQQNLMAQLRHRRLLQLGEELARAIGGFPDACPTLSTDESAWLLDPASPSGGAFLLVFHHMKHRLFHQLITNPAGACIQCGQLLGEEQGFVVGCAEPEQTGDTQTEPGAVQQPELVSVDVPDAVAKHKWLISDVLVFLSGGLQLRVYQSNGDFIIEANRKCHTRVFAYECVGGEYSAKPQELSRLQQQQIFSANAFLTETAFNKQQQQSQRRHRAAARLSAASASSAASNVDSVRPHVLLTFGQKLGSSPTRLVLWAELLHIRTWAQLQTALSD